MSNDRFDYAGMVVATFTTAVCTAVAITFSVKAVLRARAAGEGAREGSGPSGGRWLRAMRGVRPWLTTLPVFALLALLAFSLIYRFDYFSHTPVPAWKPLPPRKEAASSPDWQSWRQQVHEILSKEPVTEDSLRQALVIKRPGLSDARTEAEALRRDQAVAEILLTYDGVKKILTDRFGIRPNFLGTGLSKPLSTAPYSAATVHEYLVANHPDTHEHVWLWKITSFGKVFSMPLETLFAGDNGRIAPDNWYKAPPAALASSAVWAWAGPRSTPADASLACWLAKAPVSAESQTFDDELKVILERVKNKDHPLPPMIRFARFPRKFYRGTLGRPDADRVFTSNLSEVWDLTIEQAAEKSGYAYKDGGDTLFIWVYVPYHSNEFTPATWGQVLTHLPDWLERPND